MQPLWRTVRRCLRKLKIELPYDPAIPLLGIYPEKTKTLIRKDTCTPMFRAALFTIAKTWKQPKCPSNGEWIKKTWYIYTVEYYPAIKKHKIIPFAATWMDLEIITLNKVRQISYDITYMWNLKKWYKWTYLPIKNRNRLTDIENRLMVTKGQRGGGIN